MISMRFPSALLLVTVLLALGILPQRVPVPTSTLPIYSPADEGHATSPSQAAQCQLAPTPFNYPSGLNSSSENLPHLSATVGPDLDAIRIQEQLVRNIEGSINITKAIGIAYDSSALQDIIQGRPVEPGHYGPLYVYHGMYYANGTVTDYLLIIEFTFFYQDPGCGNVWQIGVALDGSLSGAASATIYCGCFLSSPPQLD